jgi:hypothetical protein
MGKELEKIAIESDSDMAQTVFGMDVGLFRSLALITVDFIAEMKDEDREALLHEYSEKNHELSADLIKAIADASENIYDQLVHMAMSVVTIALNFHGCCELMKGEMEIAELLGETKDE